MKQPKFWQHVYRMTPRNPILYTHHPQIPTLLVTIPWGGSHSLIKFSSIDNDMISMMHQKRPWVKLDTLALICNKQKDTALAGANGGVNCLTLLLMILIQRICGYSCLLELFGSGIRCSVLHWKSNCTLFFGPKLSSFSSKNNLLQKLFTQTCLQPVYQHNLETVLVSTLKYLEYLSQKHEPIILCSKQGKWSSHVFVHRNGHYFIKRITKSPQFSIRETITHHTKCIRALHILGV